MSLGRCLGQDEPFTYLAGSESRLWGVVEKEIAGLTTIGTKHLLIG